MGCSNVFAWGGVHTLHMDSQLVVAQGAPDLFLSFPASGLLGIKIPPAEGLGALGLFPDLLVD